MDKIVGACGLVCSGCFAYKATIKDDDKLRAKTAEFWSTIYGADIKPEDINCTGCLTDGIKFNHCKVCEMRKCCLDKGYLNCAHCLEYPCKLINDFHNNVPEAKSVLDEIKTNL